MTLWRRIVRRLEGAVRVERNWRVGLGVATHSRARGARGKQCDRAFAGGFFRPVSPREDRGKAPRRRGTGETGRRGDRTVMPPSPLKM